jgi:hypothetical protein
MCCVLWTLGSPEQLNDCLRLTDALQTKDLSSGLLCLEKPPRSCDGTMLESYTALETWKLLHTESRMCQTGANSVDSKTSQLQTCWGKGDSNKRETALELPWSPGQPHPHTLLPIPLVVLCWWSPLPGSLPRSPMGQILMTHTSVRCYLLRHHCPLPHN